jgi:hypothetical protein
MKKPRPRAAPKPRNVAAKALREGQFQPKVEENPKAYKRRPKHKPPIVPAPSDGHEPDKE